MSQDSIYGEDFYEESDHFHYMPYDIVVPTMDWIAERFYREREEFESKMAKLEQLIRMAKAMIGDLEAHHKAGTSAHTLLRRYYSRAYRARLFYSVPPLTPHDTREPRVPAEAADLLHAFPPLEPGRSNAGAIEESMRKADESAMRARAEVEHLVRYVLEMEPRIITLWRLARDDDDDGDDDDGEAKESADEEHFVESAYATLDALAEDKKKQLEGKEGGAGWKAELVVGGRDKKHAPLDGSEGNPTEK
ncbi:uncharacterized protein LTHEOB_9176 [Lasiodiplodia theobromae]|uniref:uncharacterized protein n=1 Tax=Lasiodiplodia theobromae TaxID=45133 RepID=UPI0015C35E56|nr:uncharacterized protein LTHEOB_9176 [Lasiodiplodia theobromae]KAF4540505.1 hypothetical protein LTHEOB_9176 [Lasiodiplodia theobromae]